MKKFMFSLIKHFIIIIYGCLFLFIVKTYPEVKEWFNKNSVTFVIKIIVLLIVPISTFIYLWNKFIEK